MGLDRRDFLKWISATAASTLWARYGIARAPDALPPQTAVNSPTSGSGKSLVVRVRCPRTVGYDGINRRLLRNMLTDGINEMTGSSSLASAFKTLFSPKDIIGFKFNGSASRSLGTNPALAEELLRLMLHFGFDPQKILFIEVQPGEDLLPRCGKVRFGWSKEIDFGSGRDNFAAVLDQVTALVNVGALKANSVAGMSGCLKNLAYGLIKHPARYHANRCTPYIADINRLPILRDKVRFNLLNALRILLIDPQTGKDIVLDQATLLFSRDPVAIDSSGFEMLDQVRKIRELKPLIDEGDFPSQLIVAARKGIGVYHPDRILLKTIDLNEG